jgi:thiamine-monophosphate kinase
VSHRNGRPDDPSPAIEEHAHCAVHELGEFGLIDLFEKRAGRSLTAQELGIGDDCAVLEPPAGERMLWTTDMLVEDVHFTRDTLCTQGAETKAAANAHLRATRTAALGWKSLAVSISDVAAMGGTPRAALLALGLPADTSLAFVTDFRDGFLRCARTYNIRLMGGDTVSSRHAISIAVTVLGHTTNRRVVTRAAAHPGDVVFCSRTLGDSRAGLALLEHASFAAGAPDKTLKDPLLRAHLEPRPQVALGRWLAENGVTAMIDISDGLVADLGHICHMSHLGALIEAEKLPISEAARAAGRKLRQDPVDWALYGGEDYCLLFTVDSGAAHELPRRVKQALDVEVYRVATLSSTAQTPHIELVRNGIFVPLETAKKGFHHFSPT